MSFSMIHNPSASAHYTKNQEDLANAWFEAHRLAFSSNLLLYLSNTWSCARCVVTNRTSCTRAHLLCCGRGNSNEEEVYDDDDMLIVLDGKDGTGRRRWSVDVSSDRDIGGGIICVYSR